MFSHGDKIMANHIIRTTAEVRGCQLKRYVQNNNYYNGIIALDKIELKINNEKVKYFNKLYTYIDGEEGWK